MAVLVEPAPQMLSSSECQINEPQQEPVTISETMEDAWHRVGASSEMLANLKEADRRGTEKGGRAFDQKIRVGALRCLSSMLQGTTGSQSYWFKASLLFDFCADCAGLAELPLTCAAIARIVVKSDFTLHSCVPLLSERCPGRRLIQDFSSWLSATANIETTEINDRSLCQHEQVVLKALDWQVDYPCVEQWCYIYFARIGMLAGFRTSEQLQKMQVRVSISARAILMSRPATKELSHGDVALSLFVLSFVDAGYLPLLKLKPKHLEEDDWATLYAESQLGGGELPQCHVSEAIASQILEMLCLTVQEDAEELCNKAYHVVQEMIQAFRWIQSYQSESCRGV